MKSPRQQYRVLQHAEQKAPREAGSVCSPSTPPSTNSTRGRSSHMTLATYLTALSEGSSLVRNVVGGRSTTRLSSDAEKEKRCTTTTEYMILVNVFFDSCIKMEEEGTHFVFSTNFTFSFFFFYTEYLFVLQQTAVRTCSVVCRRVGIPSAVHIERTMKSTLRNRKKKRKKH